MVFDTHKHELAMGIHVSPHREPPSHLPPHLDCHRVPALDALLHASNLHWSSILHMVIYMFQSYSLNSSHPCVLLNPKSVLLYCAACRVVITKTRKTIFIVYLGRKFAPRMQYHTPEPYIMPELQI